MTVVLPGERGAWWCPAAGDCWYCGAALPPDDLSVLWAGTPDAILLHPACARTLGAHLIADSREAELASGRQPWTRRCARMLRAGVLAEEHSA